MVDYILDARYTRIESFTLHFRSSFVEVRQAFGLACFLHQIGMPSIPASTALNRRVSVHDT
jgi:hypothetical protein